LALVEKKEEEEDDEEEEKTNQRWGCTEVQSSCRETVKRSHSFRSPWDPRSESGSDISCLKQKRAEERRGEEESRQEA